MNVLLLLSPSIELDSPIDYTNRDLRLDWVAFQVIALQSLVDSTNIDCQPRLRGNESPTCYT